MDSNLEDEEEAYAEWLTGAPKKDHGQTSAGFSRTTAPPQQQLQPLYNSGQGNIGQAYSPFGRFTRQPKEVVDEPLLVTTEYPQYSSRDTSLDDEEEAYADWLSGPPKNVNQDYSHTPYSRFGSVSGPPEQVSTTLESPGNLSEGSNEGDQVRADWMIEQSKSEQLAHLGEGSSQEDPGEVVAYAHFDWMSGPSDENLVGERSLIKRDLPEIAESEHPFNRREWEQMYSSGQNDPNYAPFGVEDGQRILGAPTMEQLWPYTPQFIGNDWNLNPDMGRALNSIQLKQLYSELIKDVVFRKLLGRGAYGEVWEVNAFYRPNDYQPWSSVKRKLRFACKVIRHRFPTKYNIEKSLNDMRNMSLLRHENICNMADTIGIPDRVTKFPYSVVCMFFELCDGDLTQFKTQSVPFGYVDEEDTYTLPENLARHWFAQIALGLEYLHGLNVVHMDIKEPNILYKITKNADSPTFENRFLWSVFKLGDFGNAKCIQMDSDSDESKKYDIIDLFKTLVSSSVPQPKGMLYLEHDFVNFCQTSKLEEGMPLEWQLFSDAFKDLCSQMYSLNKTIDTSEEGITATDILFHPWLQENDEPRTDRFIFKNEQVKVDEHKPGYIPQFVDFVD